MIYEAVGQDEVTEGPRSVVIDEADDTSLRHAAREGVHDAISDIVKFGVIGVIAVVVLKIAGEKRIKQYSRRARSIL